MRQPTRVVFDSEARLPLDSQLVGDGRRGAARGRRRRRRRRASAIAALRDAGAEAVSSATGTRRARVGAGARGARAPRGHQRCCWRAARPSPAAFRDAGEIDELRLFIAPIVLGGRGRRPLIGGAGAARDAPTRPRRLRWTGSAPASDLLVRARLREW